MFRLEKIFALLVGAFCVFAIAFYSKFLYVNQKQRGKDHVSQPIEREMNSDSLADNYNDQSESRFRETEGRNYPDEEGWSFSDDAQPRKKYLVYYCSGRSPCGGWGDRLRGMISTYVMSILTNRGFAINMTSPCPLATWLSPNEIQWNELLQSDTKLDEVFVDIHDNTRFAHLLKTVDLSRFFRNDVVKLAPNYDLFSRLKQNPLYHKQLTAMSQPEPGKAVSLFTRIYEKLFTMNHNLEFHVSKFLAGLYETARRRTLICAQVRMGKNPSIPRDTKIVTRPSELKALWNFLSEYKDDKRYKIFVTTDSETVREKARKLFPQQILDTSGPITHPDYRHGNQSCSGLGKVILDQYLLRFCDTLVISKSLYGIIGAHLRGRTSDLYQFSNGTISRKALSGYQLFNF